MSESVTTRVRRGAKLLDQKKPGWHAEIDCRKLKLSDCSACIIGQVCKIGTCGGFMHEIEALGVYDNGEDFGLAPAGGDCKALREAWTREIVKRRNPKGVRKAKA